MVTQQVPGRSEGQKAMDESLSQTEKVKRQLKAGRPRRTTAPPATVFEAVQRLHGEATRARVLMGRYGLDEQDIGLALLCRTHDPRLARILRAPLPGDGRIRADSSTNLRNWPPPLGWIFSEFFGNSKRRTPKENRRFSFG